MADRKISELTNITGANLADGDELVVVDASASETKAITFGEFKNALDTATGFVSITGDTMTGDLALSGADITFGDNDKAIFGAGSDLQIYHDPVNGSIVKDNGVGRLLLDSENGTGISLTSGGIAKTMISATKDSDVKLYYDNALKLATTSTGVDITGTLTSDGLTVDGDLRINTTSGKLTYVNDIAGWTVDMEDGTSDLYIRSGVASPTDRLKIEGNGDISFYEDTGTTAKFFWDASAESLGIGTSSPSDYRLHLYRGGANLLKLESTTATAIFDFVNSSGSGAIVSQYDNMFFNTAGTERMRIDSSGNVGIGSSSTDALESRTAQGYRSLRLNNFNINAGEGSYGFVGQNIYQDSAGVYKFIDTGDSSSIHFWGNAMQFHMANGSADATQSSSERMRIDSSGNVGIGVVPENWLSTYTALQIRSAASVIGSTDNSFVGIGANAYLDSADTRYEYINSDYATQYYQVDGTHVWRYAPSGTADAAITWSEAMRIDSSGNLLVGTTTTNTQSSSGGTNTGTWINSAGIVNVGSNSNAAAYLNRQSTDGDIAVFRKDGTTVGSIGSEGSGARLYINQGDTGIGMQSNIDSVIPVSSNGGARNNAIDLGYSTVRWKDLYLSGGVYLGGTGAANKLDDYEEGTWDPTFLAVSGSFGSITYDAFTKGAYTRIGRVVYITGTIRTDAITIGTASVGVKVDGLPFTVAANDPTSSRNMLSPLALSDQTSFGSDSPNRAEFSPSATSFVLQKQSSISSNIALLLPSDLGTGADSNRLAFSGFYFTDA